MKRSSGFSRFSRAYYYKMFDLVVAMNKILQVNVAQYVDHNRVCNLFVITLP